MDLELSTSGPSGPWVPLASGLPDNGRFQWTVNAPASDTCRIRVTTTSATATTNSISPNDFRILGDSPGLSVDTTTVSAAGGSVHFVLQAGVALAGRPYLLVGGASGSSPGTLLPGGLVTLPVNQDALTDLILAFLNTSIFSGFQGVLDPTGSASADLNIPPVPALAGTVMSFAFATTNPFDFASNAVTVTLIP